MFYFVWGSFNRSYFAHQNYFKHAGKDSKKAAALAAGTSVNADALPVFPVQSQMPTLTSGVAATLAKGFGHKTPLILSNHTLGPANPNQSNNHTGGVQTLCQLSESSRDSLFARMFGNRVFVKFSLMVYLW